MVGDFDLDLDLDFDLGLAGFSSCMVYPSADRVVELELGNNSINPPFSATSLHQTRIGSRLYNTSPSLVAITCE